MREVASSSVDTRRDSGAVLSNFSTNSAPGILVAWKVISSDSSRTQPSGTVGLSIQALVVQGNHVPVQKNKGYESIPYST